MSSQIQPLKIPEIPVEKVKLHQPTLDEIASVLNSKLKADFKEVLVDVVECPDLTEKPFSLASKGLCGSPTIVEIGGVPYLLPTPMLEKLYDLKDLPKIVNFNPTYVIGAGAGPWPYAGTNCEMIVNMGIKDGVVDNHTRIGKVNEENGQCIQEILPNSETRSALLANLFLSKGLPGKVLRVSCKIRTGTKDFIESIRTALAEEYKNEPVGLGGVFLVSEGKVLQHIMQDFSKVPLNTESDLKNWLKLYDMSTPLTAVGTLVSADPGLDLRVQHFHSFSHHGEAGHYHNDKTPETIQYLGYFSVGEEIYRLDKPKVTHTMGRD